MSERDATTIANEVRAYLSRRSRWRPLELVFWAAAFATLFVLPGKHLILTEVAILGLFALSLDLILGYARILSLGHAAFFGLGAYTAGLLAKYGWGEPFSGLVLAAGTPEELAEVPDSHTGQFLRHALGLDGEPRGARNAVARAAKANGSPATKPRTGRTRAKAAV